MLRPTLKTAAPALTLVTLADAKSHLRVDFDDDDALITGLINAAASHLDGYSGIVGRALLDQNWEQNFSGFCTRMELPVGIASSVVSIKYYDSTNVQQTLSSSVYQLLTDELGSYVSLKSLQVWPATYSRVDAVTVEWIAGYGATVDLVPAALIVAMKMLISHWYENREAVVVNMTAEELPLAIKSLIGPFRRIGL